MNDRRVVALRGKVAVKRDEAFATTAAAVEIATADGKLHKLQQRAARGSEDNPMSDRDLEGKLREAAAHGCGADRGNLDTRWLSRYCNAAGADRAANKLKGREP